MQKITHEEKEKLKEGLLDYLLKNNLNIKQFSDQNDICYVSVWGWLRKDKNISFDTYHKVDRAICFNDCYKQDEFDDILENSVIEQPMMKKSNKFKVDEFKQTVGYLLSQKDAIDSRINELETELQELYSMQSLLKSLGGDK